MVYDICESLVNEYQEYRDFDGFKMELIRVLSIDSPFDEKGFFEGNPTELIEDLHELAVDHYARKSELIANTAFPVIKDVFENQ